MSMSTRIVGFKPTDEKWEKMKKVYDSCCDAELGVPKEVWDFFNNISPDDAGVLVELKDHECCSGYSGDHGNGFEINIKKLPKDVTIVRFTNSF